MSSNLNGGFFVTLGLDTNKNSFEEGRKAIDQIGVGVTNLLGTVRTAVPLIAAGLTAINDRTADTYASSAALGFSVRQYEAWGAAAKQCKVNAEGLYSGMEKLESIRVRIKHGDAGAADSLSNPLGLLDITDLATFIKQDPAEKVAQVFEAASAKVKSGVMDLKEASDTVGQVLGGEFGKLFMNERTLGLSFFKLIDKYYTDSYMDQDAAKKAMGFNREAEDTMYLLKQMGEFAGAEFGGAFTPMLKELNEFLRDHKDDIKAGMTDLANSIGNIINALAPIASGVFKTAADMFMELVHALSALANGNWNKAGENLKNFFETFAEGVTNILWGDPKKYDNAEAKEVIGLEGKDRVQATISATAQANSEDKETSEKGKRKLEAMQARKNVENLINRDRPMGIDKLLEDPADVSQDLLKALWNYELLGGNIDDFLYTGVFNTKDKRLSQKVIDFIKKEFQTRKAREKTDGTKAQQEYLKKAGRLSFSSSLNNELLSFAGALTHSFIPMNNSINSGGNVINQNITINGAADVATAVREEAYRGANEGLLGAINAGAQRLQLMTGLS